MCCSEALLHPYHSCSLWLWYFSLDILLKLRFFIHISGKLTPSPLGKFILAGILNKLPQQYPELQKYNLPKLFHSEQLPNVPEGVNIGRSGLIA